MGCLTGLTPPTVVASRNSLGSQDRAVIMDLDCGAGCGAADASPRRSAASRRVATSLFAGAPCPEQHQNRMKALPIYATAVTVTLCSIVVAVMAAISYVAARQHGSDHRSAVAVTLGVGAILAAWLAAAAAIGGAEVFLARPSSAVPAIAGGVAIPIVTGVLLTRIRSEEHTSELQSPVHLVC